MYERGLKGQPCEPVSSLLPANFHQSCWPGSFEDNPFASHFLLFYLCLCMYELQVNQGAVKYYKNKRKVCTFHAEAIVYMNKSEEKFLRKENSMCYSMSSDWKSSLSWSQWNGWHAGKITLCHTSWLALMCCSCLPLCRRAECYTLTFWSSLQFIFSPGFSKLLKREQGA